MVTLDLKQTAIESLAPDKDPVSDAVNPLGGLKTIAQGLADLQKTYEEKKSEYVMAQSLGEFSEKSANNQADFFGYITTLDTSDASSIPDKMNAYAHEKHAEMSRYIESIGDRRTRNHLRSLNNHDLATMRSRGLQYSMGIMKQNSIIQIETGTISASTSLTLDPSNENRLTQLERLSQQIDVSGLTPEDKLKYKRDARRTLNESQVRAIQSRTPHLFEDYFDIVHEPSAPIKDSLSPVERVEALGKRTVELNEDKIRKNNSVDGWNELDHATRGKLLKEFATRTDREMSKERSRINKDVKRITKHAFDGKITEDFDDVSSLSNLLKGMNYDDAKHTHGILKLVKEMSSLVPLVSTGTDDEFEKTIVDLNSSAVTGDMRVKSTISDMIIKLNHIRKESKKLLSKDPHAWGHKYNQIEPLNLETGRFGDSLVSYSSFAQETEKKHGVVVKGLGSAGEKQLEDRMMREKSSDFVQFIKSETEALCKEDKEKAKNILSHLKKGSLSAISLLAMGETLEEKEVARRIAVGAKNYKDIDSQYKALSGVFFSNNYDKIINKEIGKLYQGSEDAHYKKDAEAVKLYIMGSMRESGHYQLSSEVVRDAVKTVFGNTAYNVNGSYVLPPRGMSHREFGDRLHVISSDKLVALFGDKSQDRYPESYGYRTMGDGKYLLTKSGVTAKDASGNPLIVNVYDAPTPRVPRTYSPLERAMIGAREHLDSLERKNLKEKKQ